MPAPEAEKPPASPRRRLGRAILIGLVLAVLLVELGFRVAVGARPILVRTGNGLVTERSLDNANKVLAFDDLGAAARFLVENKSI